MWPTRNHQVERTDRWPQLDEHAPTEAHIDAPTAAELVTSRTHVVVPPTTIRSEELSRAPVRAGDHVQAA